MPTISVTATIKKTISEIATIKKVIPETATFDIVVSDLFLPTDLPNLKIWLKSDIGITKDGLDAVSSWADESGQGNDVTQATGSKQPLFVANQLDGKPSIRTDGIDDFLQSSAFTWVQPETIYMVFNVVSFDINGIIFDNIAGNGPLMQETTPPQELHINAGINSGDIAAPLGVYAIFTCIFNGSSSVFQKDNDAELTGDFGTNDSNGLTLGRFGSGTLESNVDFVEIIGYAAAHNTTQRTQIKTYLANRYPSL